MPKCLQIMCAKYHELRCMFYKKNLYSSKLARLLDTASKFALFSASGLKDKKLINKQAYTKTETCKPYSRVFWIFLPNFIKIDRYTVELCRFKVDAFFETQCTSLERILPILTCIEVANLAYRPNTLWWRMKISTRVGFIMSPVLIHSVRMNWRRPIALYYNVYIDEDTYNCSVQWVLL